MSAEKNSMSWDVTMGPEELQMPREQLNPSSPSRLHTSPPQHAHWDPGGVKAFSTPPPSSGQTMVFTSCPPALDVGVAKPDLPTTDPAEVSKGTMGHVISENGADQNNSLSLDKGLMVPLGVQGPLETDVSGLDITETTQATNDQGHPLAPVSMLDNAQGPIGAHGPAEVDDSTPSLPDPMDGSDSGGFSCAAELVGNDEAVMPHPSIMIGEEGSLVIGLKPCVCTDTFSELEKAEYVTGMLPIKTPPLIA